MKKMLFVMAAAFIMMFGNGMTAEAAPKIMPDGNLFDAEFYAQTYPDVVAVFGTDENMLYQHYALCGMLEGRMSYLPGSEQILTETQTMPVEVLDVETYNLFPKVYGQSYNEQLWSKTSDVIQAIPSIWAGTADEVVQLVMAGIFKEDSYVVTFPETGYGNTYSKFYNYTVTGKVKECFKYAGGGKQLPVLILFLENSYGVEFRVEVSPDTPFTIGENITIKGYTDWFGNGRRGIQIISTARNLPLYEW